MKLLALLLLLAPAPAAELEYFRYERPVAAPQVSGQSCVALDPGVFAHAAPGLADLRLYRDGVETPYALRSAERAELTQRSITPLNLGEREGKVVFDAAMPAGRYRDVELAVHAEDFLARVTVSGGNSEEDKKRTQLGVYTIFDLTSQHLSRSTVLHLPESDFRYLHFAIAGTLGAKSIAGVSVVGVPVTQLRYLTITASKASAGKGGDSEYRLHVAAHTPVDRVTFMPAEQPVEFRREVTIAVQPERVPAGSDASLSSEADSGETDTNGPAQPVFIYGALSRVHRVVAGDKVDKEQLAIDTGSSRGADSGRATVWTVTVHNGNDVQLALRSVSLQMLERQLCFDAAAGAAYTLYYGDPALAAPRYDYAELFAARSDAAQLFAGAEAANPRYRPRSDLRPFTERHPALLWIALVAVLLLLALVALRSAKLAPSA